VKVLLISHPDPHRQKPDFPPIGIAYLGAVIRDRGHEVRLVDGGLTVPRGIARQARDFAPDVVGATCWTINRGSLWGLGRLLREELPDVPFVVGGPHASLFPDHIFRKTHARVVVIGEGEETIGELLEAMETGRDLTTVPGLAIRASDGTVQRTPPRPQIRDLDAVPFPFYEGFRDFSFRRYAGFPGLPGPTAAIITSRGCVFDCSYCGSVSYWGRKWRYRSSQNVLDELEHLAGDLGVRSVYFFDDNFPVNRERVIQICRGMIDRRLNIAWACCSHVKMVQEGLLRAMREAGCRYVAFGVESGSDVILGNINKKQTRADIERAFALVHESGMKPRAFLMVGNRGESDETIDQTIAMTGVIRPHSSIGASLLWLLPGTRVYAEARAAGHIDDDYWLRSDDVPYNLQEHSYAELQRLRRRLMRGIARNKGGLLPLANCYMKEIYYRYPALSALRALVPARLR
jgi:radical SAM superfamily enzyme YgiQ (UPF0313 family)